jgi:hypothetical protein
VKLNSGRSEGEELLFEVTTKSCGRPQASHLVEKKRMFPYHLLEYIRTGNVQLHCTHTCIIEPQ